MKKKLFAELLGSMGEALDHARGKRELRTTALPPAPRAMSASDVRALRDQLNASQAVFAKFLNVSPQLVRAWESNRRRPGGAALRLLEVATHNPATVFGTLAATSRLSSARAVKVGRGVAKRVARRQA